ncbi:MAG: septum formation initiator family protein [Hymenobacter sp.]|nr:MAG: septum formation initiator family protein [Hymenobacter sp.]
MQLPSILSPILRTLRNFYFLTGTAFVVWMVLFDGNDVSKQYDMYRKWQELRAEKEYYESSIKAVQHDRAELLSSPALLEKFAREKYLMKRPGEDVFVLVPKEEEK